MTAEAMIDVVGDDWGTNWDEEARRQMRAMLHLAAGVLLPYFDAQCTVRIRVRRSHRNPETRYTLDPDGAYATDLNTGERYWAQIAYQFSHEFCHILSNYRNQQWDADKWFDEALCETASLFVLRELARAWTSSPLYENNPTYGSELARYAQERLDDPKRQLPIVTPMADWYQTRRKHLRSNRYDRPLTDLISSYLLPLFEEVPGRWRALRYLNMGVATPQTSFPEHLRMWSEQAPKEFRSFVARTADLFGVSEEAGIHG